MFSPSAGSTDGKDVEVSGWLPALEFGASLCPVQLILREFEKRRQTLKDGSFPSAVLVMVDNLGIAHAPFASARSLLSENGYKDTRVLYGSVILDGEVFRNPAPTRMIWRPDKMICEYDVGGVLIREEKFIGANDDFVFSGSLVSLCI